MKTYSFICLASSSSSSSSVVEESVAAFAQGAAAAWEVASGERGRSRAAHSAAVTAPNSKDVKVEEQVVVVARKRSHNHVDTAAAVIPVGDTPCHEGPAG